MGKELLLRRRRRQLKGSSSYDACAGTTDVSATLGTGDGEP